MNLWVGAFRAEGRKALSSPVPWATGLAILLFPLLGTLFMVIVRDPEGAKALGLIGAKARLSGLTADGPSYLGLLNQALAVGFLFLSALSTSWVFGRESSDRTLKLLLAVPVGRSRVVVAKLMIISVWGVGSLALMALAGVGAGWALALPDFDASLVMAWLPTFSAVGLSTLVLTPWVAFVASAGRGYLAPLAYTLGCVALAQISVVLGWGEWVPWAIPALWAGTGNATAPGPLAPLLVLATGLAGVIAVLRFWTRADHPR